MGVDFPLQGIPYELAPGMNWLLTFYFIVMVEIFLDILFLRYMLIMRGYEMVKILQKRNREPDLEGLATCLRAISCPGPVTEKESQFYIDFLYSYNPLFMAGCYLFQNSIDSVKECNDDIFFNA